MFNRLCRKAFDVSLRNNVHRLPNSTTFVVPIANELYQHYYASEFRFTDKGITPQRIANDLLIHYEPCDEVEVEVDAFGAINVWPTQRYHERCLAEIVDNENYGYLPIGNWKI